MMRKVLVGVALLAMAALAGAQGSSAAHSSELKDGKGNVVGTVTVTGAPHGVVLRVEAKGLTPGWHGIHIHEKGECSDAAFKSAGGHVHAKTPATHGLLNPDANEAGDLPNIFVASDGTANAEFFTNAVTLDGAEGKPALLDADGSSIVIHASPDDYKTQPIGGAGARVACSVIK